MNLIELFGNALIEDLIEKFRCLKSIDDCIKKNGIARYERDIKLLDGDIERVIGEINDIDRIISNEHL